MSIELKKGANVSLAKLAPNVTDLLVELSWCRTDDVISTFDIDGSCFLLDEKYHVRNNEDFVFYNQTQDPDQAVCLIEELEHVDGSNYKTAFSVSLKNITEQICHVVFCLTIHKNEEKKQNFNMLDRITLRLLEQETLKEITRYQYEKDVEEVTAILVGECYQYNGEWKFKAIGQGYVKGLDALARNFGVVLDEVHSARTDASQKVDELVISKRKRKATKDVIQEQMGLIKSKMKPFLSQIAASRANSINESSTRLILDRIFQDVLGYSIEEIKTEQKIQGRAADYVLSPNGRDSIVVEAKRAGVPLRAKQIFQATSYAAYSGINWAILTNLVEWHFYKVSTVDKVDPHLLFTIDMTQDLDNETIYNLMLISKFGVARKGLIDKVWLKKVSLRVETLIGAILNDEVISKIRTIISKETGGKVTNEEVKKAIESDILRL